MAETIIQVVYPESHTDISMEEYEWMLIWFTRKGVPTSWLFYDWKNLQDVKNTIINVKDSENIRSISNSEDRIIELTAEDITRDQKNAFQDLLVSKNVFRLYRTDSILYEQSGRERVGVLSGKIEWINSKQRFKITIQIQRYEMPLAR